jgi:HlyD family secretion protein
MSRPSSIGHVAAAQHGADQANDVLMKHSRRIILLAVAAVVAVSVAIVAWRAMSHKDANEIVLYGNVDLRQIALAFNAGERVAQMRVEEGDSVHVGQVLAVLDTASLALRIDQSRAQSNVQEQALRRLEAGSRPEEIAQARAAVAVAQASADNAAAQHQRLRDISRSTRGRAVSRQDLDSAGAAQAMAQAQLESARKALELVVAGPRKEDIAQARAQFAAARAQQAVLEQQLRDAELKAPVDAVVRSRLLEPGDMASPQRPAYMLAIVNPKWVRAYLSEPDLGRVRPGDPAGVYTDSHPDRKLDGRVGYISSVAEFTPRTVQTEELRTSLVYEVRILVDDPDNRLRLGMPATVRMRPDAVAARTPGAGETKR